MFNLSQAASGPPDICNEDHISIKKIQQEIQSVLSAPLNDQAVHGQIVYARTYSDLNYLAPSSLAKWMKMKLPNLMVIDCRYPYEYEGGHIEGAVNLHTEQMIEDCLLRAPIIDKHTNSPVLVFHCEYSSCRGPTRYRFLRKQDRKMNFSSYPHLCYPHIYLLEGGYKQFYSTFPTLCSGGYVQMTDKMYKDQKKAHKRKQKSL